MNGNAEITQRVMAGETIISVARDYGRHMDTIRFAVLKHIKKTQPRVYERAWRHASMRASFRGRPNIHGLRRAMTELETESVESKSGAS